VGGEGKETDFSGYLNSSTLQTLEKRTRTKATNQTLGMRAAHAGLKAGFCQRKCYTPVRTGTERKNGVAKRGGKEGGKVTKYMDFFRSSSHAGRSGSQNARDLTKKVHRRPRGPNGESRDRGHGEKGASFEKQGREVRDGGSREKVFSHRIVERHSM